MTEVTPPLGGDKQAAAAVLPLVYDELRKLAAGHLAREAPGQTLTATAARVCAGLMTPLALMELSPNPLPPDELRTMTIGLVLLRQGDAAARKLARARAEYAERNPSPEWGNHIGDYRRVFLMEAEKAIEGKK